MPHMASRGSQLSRLRPLETTTPHPKGGLTPNRCTVSLPFKGGRGERLRPPACRGSPCRSLFTADIKGIVRLVGPLGTPRLDRVRFGSLPTARRSSRQGLHAVGRRGVSPVFPQTLVSSSYLRRANHASCLSRPRSTPFAAIPLSVSGVARRHGALRDAFAWCHSTVECVLFSAFDLCFLFYANPSAMSHGPWSLI